MYFVVETKTICFATQVDKSFCTKFKYVKDEIPNGMLVSELDATKTYSKTMLLTKAYEIFGQSSDGESFITDECGELLCDLIRTGHIIDETSNFPPAVDTQRDSQIYTGELRSRFE